MCFDRAFEGHEKNGAIGNRNRSDTCKLKLFGDAKEELS